MDTEVQRRIERLERTVNEEDRISRLERKTIRIGMLVSILLTILVIIVSKLSEVIHAVKLVWKALAG
jgi:cell fate (sporulation/competence/biofilm development) regulator YlbF (YheA/YmcA/DUF963 family)